MKPREWLRLGLYGTIAVTVWAGVGFLPLILFRDGEVGKVWTMRGQFGDMFGAANSLIAALAFAGFLFTIRQQQEQLKKQSEESNQNLIRLAEQNRLLGQQLETLRESFEFDKRKALLESGPNFQWRDYAHNETASGPIIVYKFQNLGGNIKVRHVTISPDTWITISPRDQIAHNQEGILQIGSRPPSNRLAKEYKIEIGYQTTLGFDSVKKFRLSIDTGDIVELRE